MPESFLLRLSDALSLDMQTLRFLAEAVPHQVWITDADGRAIYANRKLQDYAGIRGDRFDSQEWRRLIHPENLTDLLQSWQDAHEKKIDMFAEARLKRVDGVYRWHAIRGTAQHDTKGNLLLWVGTNTDIDDQKQTEQTLKASEANFRVLAEAVPQLVWIARADGFVTYYNPQYYAYTHSTFEEMRGFGWRQFLLPDDLERVLAIRIRYLPTGEH